VSGGAPGYHDGVEPVIVGRQALLVGLVASQKPVLRHPVANGLAERVHHEDGADGAVIPSRIAPALVVGLDALQPESEPGSDRSTVELQEPET
jgi:hypothetical protein